MALDLEFLKIWIVGVEELPGLVQCLICKHKTFVCTLELWKILGVVVHGCNFSTRKADRGGPLELACQPV